MKVVQDTNSRLPQNKSRRRLATKTGGIFFYGTTLEEAGTIQQIQCTTAFISGKPLSYNSFDLNRKPIEMPVCVCSLRTFQLASPSDPSREERKE